MASRAMRTFCGIDRPWRGYARFAFRRPGARSRRGTIARWIVREQWLEAGSQHKLWLNTPLCPPRSAGEPGRIGEGLSGGTPALPAMDRERADTSVLRVLE